MPFRSHTVPTPKPDRLKLYKEWESWEDAVGKAIRKPKPTSPKKQPEPDEPAD